MPVVLVVATAIVIGTIVAVVAQAVSDAVRGLADTSPHLVDTVRRSEVGNAINDGSGWPTRCGSTWAHHQRVGRLSGGVATSASPALERRDARSVGRLPHALRPDRRAARTRLDRGLLYRDERSADLHVTGSDMRTTRRATCRQRGHLRVLRGGLRRDRGDPRPSVPVALRSLSGVLNLIPSLGATLAGLVIGLVALSVSVEALIVSAIVIVVYQQLENYVLQSAIIGRAADVSGGTMRRERCPRSEALLGVIGAIIAVPIASGPQIVTEELTAARRARIAAAERRGRGPDDGAPTTRRPVRVRRRGARGASPRCARRSFFWLDVSLSETSAMTCSTRWAFRRRRRALPDPPPRGCSTPTGRPSPSHSGATSRSIRRQADRIPPATAPARGRDHRRVPAHASPGAGVAAGDLAPDLPSQRSREYVVYSVLDAMIASTFDALRGGRAEARCPRGDVVPKDAQDEILNNLK